jgi:hypothetical protein
MTPEEAQEVDAAIASHSQWLNRIRKAIAKGKSECRPEVVRLDDRCVFGKWLYGACPVRGTPAFDKVPAAARPPSPGGGEHLGPLSRGQGDGSGEVDGCERRVHDPLRQPHPGSACAEELLRVEGDSAVRRCRAPGAAAARAGTLRWRSTSATPLPEDTGS